MESTKSDAFLDGSLLALMDESLEQPGFQLDGDTRTVVDHRTDKGAGLQHSVDPDVRSAVLAGVGEQIAEDLPETEPVGSHHPGFAFDLDRHAGPPHRFNHLGDLVEDLDVLERVVQRPGVETGGGQQVFDHAPQVGRLADDQADQLGRHLGLFDLGFFLEEHGQPVDSGQRSSEFVRSVGDELLAGMADIPLRLQSSLEFGLSLLASHELAVDEDDGPGYEERNQEPGDRAHRPQELVRRPDLGPQVVPDADQHFGHRPEVRIELRVGHLLRGSRVVALEQRDDLPAGPLKGPERVTQHIEGCRHVLGQACGLGGGISKEAVPHLPQGGLGFID